MRVIVIGATGHVGTYLVPLLVEALRGRVSHLLVCGTIKIHGPSTRVPLREEDARNPFGEYGINKLAMERLLEAETRRGGLAATTIHQWTDRDCRDGVRCGGLRNSDAPRVSSRPVPMSVARWGSA